MSENTSIDKLAASYTEDGDDTKAYIKAQQSTIISQTKSINELRKKFEEVSVQMEQLVIENTRLKALGPAGVELDIDDAETIAIVQIALMKNYAMQRELTLEEVKKYEICTKVLVLLKGKKEVKDTNTISGLSNEELLAAMKEM